MEAVSKICRLHFDPDDIIEYNGKKKGHWRVREGAIPTMFIANDAEDKPKTYCLNVLACTMSINTFFYSFFK